MGKRVFECYDQNTGGNRLLLNIYILTSNLMFIFGKESDLITGTVQLHLTLNTYDLLFEVLFHFGNSNMNKIQCIIQGNPVCLHFIIPVCLMQSGPYHRLSSLHAPSQRLCFLCRLSSPGSGNNYVGV